ncbi:MAG: hypothetical protein CMF38_06455 [Legionellaceae bacterium]|nr:hypothetical protein [Legionellaceae bacterium]HAF87846.1 hypothetical protein [Legionellales bacterium]HCA89188.1 hypothetical protein [Legionellales bacterium]|tara:strand:- start:2438 stop:2662 length:225 start_codon:yes stop_codon:yes gene_type:complete
MSCLFIKVIKRLIICAGIIMLLTHCQHQSTARSACLMPPKTCGLTGFTSQCLYQQQGFNMGLTDDVAYFGTTYR